MGFLPILSEQKISKEVVEKFGGLNTALRINNGECRDEKNLSAREFPVLCTRKHRAIGAELTAPGGIIAKNALAYVDGVNLVYNGTTVNLGLSSAVPKQLINMGAYILIFPDKKYFNTQKATDFGSMEASASVTGAAKATICKDDGTEYTYVTTKPTEPTDGQRWLDGDTLKEWDAETSMWTVMVAYLKLPCPNCPFADGDGVEISGLSGEYADLNGTRVVVKVGSGFMVVSGKLANFSGGMGNYTAARLVPDMDYVTECGNRVWGCKYGAVGDKTVNEIYACKLGDFKNWSCFQGLSTDSYAASRGSDGPWTGAVTYGGQPIFFKENAIEKVYPSNSGAHQIVSTATTGVQDGSWRSLQVVGSYLFYKGVDGIYAYAGSIPTLVSENIGGVFHDARGGWKGRIYYVSMANEANAYSLFTFDTEKKIWHKEDAVKALGFANYSGECYYIEETTGKIVKVDGFEGTYPDGWEADTIEWSWESGDLGLDTTEHKYISRIVIRAKCDDGVFVWAKYDDGSWTKIGGGYSKRLGSFVIPVLPRRCDNVAIKLSGKGEAKIYSISKMIEKGSDIQW